MQLRVMRYSASWIDAHSKYNQIKMHPPKEDNTAFITDRGIYFYKVMPFGLNNAGATFRQMVNKVLKEQIRQTSEIYIDDMLRKYKVRLNPEKCTFRVASGKFLGYWSLSEASKLTLTRYLSSCTRSPRLVSRKPRC